METIDSENVVIVGGKKIQGRILAQGDKTIAVHLLMCSLFLKDTSLQIAGFPLCKDVLSVLNWMKENTASRLILKKDFLEIECLAPPNISDITSLNFIRSSICLVTPLTLQNSEVVFGEIGGCNFTHRPVNRHIELAEAFGIVVNEISPNLYKSHLTKYISDVDFDCSVSKIPSVGVTCHALISTLVFNGQVRLNNIAIDPSIMFLIKTLQHYKEIEFNQNLRTIIIGKNKTDFPSIIAEKIPFDISAALTYIAASVATGGEIEIFGEIHFPESVNLLFDKLNILRKANPESTTFSSQSLTNPNQINCDVAPGIPTDCGPILAALLCNIDGQCEIIDSVYNFRDSHVIPLQLMGYQINFKNNTSFISGVRPNDIPINVRASDIRAGAAILIASLIRNGITNISNFHEINRGYFEIISNLKKLGASIK